LVVVGHEQSRKPIVQEFKFKSWVEPRGSDPDAFTLDKKVYEAYSCLRESLLVFITVAQFRAEGSHKIVLTFLERLWKEYSLRGEDVPDGDYLKHGKCFLELDLNREPGDRLAIVSSITEAL
jgi:hypothetical protein